MLLKISNLTTLIISFSYHLYSLQNRSIFWVDKLDIGSDGFCQLDNGLWSPPEPCMCTLDSCVYFFWRIQSTLMRYVKLKFTTLSTFYFLNLCKRIPYHHKSIFHSVFLNYGLRTLCKEYPIVYLLQVKKHFQLQQFQ